MKYSEIGDSVTTTFKEDMPKVWGNWGVSSEIGKLRAVLVRKGGAELENKNHDFKKYRWSCAFNPVKVREQQESLYEVYRNHGVDIYFIEETSPEFPNAIFVRDQVLMTPEGAIVCRAAVKSRVGEEKWAAKQLMKIGIPIIHTVCGEGIFEGACVIWLDKETVFLGEGYRCNSAGSIQVENTLRSIGVKNFIKVNIPRGQAHLDGFMAIVDTNVALTYRIITPNIVYEELLKRDFNIIEIPCHEEWKHFATNFVALEPGKVVGPSGNPKTQKLLEDAGVEYIALNLDEIIKGNGATHCMTAFLKRDEILSYKI